MTATPAQPQYLLRNTLDEDIAAILRIQRECYPASMQEDASTIASRIAAAGDTCWVALDRDGVCAYLFAYRSMLGSVTPLGGGFCVRPDGDSLYLHDLAVSSRCAGQGVGRLALSAAFDFARRRAIGYSSLVAVQGAQAYWERLGYRGWDALAPDQRARLLSYPGDPGYMVARLTA